MCSTCPPHDSIYRGREWFGLTHLCPKFPMPNRSPCGSHPQTLSLSCYIQTNQLAVIWMMAPIYRVTDSLGLHAQSVVATSKGIFPTRVAQGCTSNSLENNGLTHFFPLQTSYKTQIPCLVSPTPPSGCQAHDFVL
jgi:hypothetical protein